MGGGGLVSHLVHLSVVVPQAIIPGNGEYHVDTGSTISLTCFVEQVNMGICIVINKYVVVLQFIKNNTGKWLTICKL